MKHFLKSAAQLLLLWLAIIGVVIAAAVFLAAVDPLKGMTAIHHVGGFV
jgi:hypothetical protein